MNKQQRNRLLQIATRDKKLLTETVILLTQIFQSSFERQVAGRDKNIFNLQASATIGQAGTEIINLIDKQKKASLVSN